jgi:hypothetical protein
VRANRKEENNRRINDGIDKTEEEKKSNGDLNEGDKILSHT